MSDIQKTVEAYLSMVSEASCGKDRMKKEEKKECPKCDGDGCDHCDGTGYHEMDEAKSKEQQIADLEKMLDRISGNTSSVKMKKVALQRKIDKLKNEELDEAKNYEIKDGKVHISKANFRKVHKDYKNATKGKERMMALDPKSGATKSFQVVFTEEVELDEKKLDPVNDKENDKKFKDRKDKDIDNDGDVDSSDEYLHKKRAATDDAIDGGKKPADNADDKKKKDKNPKTSDSTAEISKIESVSTKESFELLWDAIEEAVNQKKGATEPEKMDSKASGKEKEFVAKHPVDSKDHEELETIEEPKERKVKKEMKEYEVIRALLSGNPTGE